ncbi:MAG: Nif11-like leader peptide family natural product precursor [Candidatus Absconditabacterales bacterium]|jgi:hypothetical protein
MCEENKRSVSILTGLDPKGIYVCETPEMTVEELKKEYETQDNRCTAYPIYVTVQELHCVGVLADGYSVCCPYGAGEERTEYGHPDLQERFDSRQEVIEELKDRGYDVTEDELDDIEELSMGYIWHPVEFFLTIKGAEEYMKANAHNHGKLRTYVHYFEDRNFEMRALLKELGFRTN